MEIWKDIEGYEGLYQVSNLGRVKALKRKIKKSDGSTQIYRERILKYDKSISYLRIKLCKNGIETKYLIHRLVAETFIDNPDNKPQVNHIDGIKTNNCVQNLEWCTAKENVIHSVNSGLKSKIKLNEKQILEIRESKELQTKLAEVYNVSIATINDIKHRRTWKHI